MATKQEIIATLRTLKPQLLTQFKVKEIGLFGSYVRGDQKESSDVDLLVDFSEKANLFDLVRLATLLEERWHCHVDIVPKDTVRPELRAAILKEVEVV